jgi:hypothetical protein
MSLMFGLLQEEQRYQRRGGSAATPKVEVWRAGPRLRFSKTASRPRGPNFGYVSSTAHYRKAIVKTRYFRRSSDSNRRVSDSIRYYQDRRRDPESEPEQRKIFDRRSDDISRAEAVQKILSHQGKRISAHELILSPGDNSLDLIEYTRNVMHELEERVGEEIHWIAVEHKNTDHFHTHVMLAGQAGERVRQHAHTLSVEIRFNRQDLDFLRWQSDIELSRQRGFDRQLGIDRHLDFAIEREFLPKNKDYDLKRARDSREYDKQVFEDLGLEHFIPRPSELLEIGLPPENKILMDDRHDGLNDELHRRGKYIQPLFTDAGPVQSAWADQHTEEERFRQHFESAIEQEFSVTEPSVEPSRRDIHEREDRKRRGEEQ